jgi:hypothetical protein
MYAVKRYRLNVADAKAVCLLDFTIVKMLKCRLGSVVILDVGVAY